MPRMWTPFDRGGSTAELVEFLLGRRELDRLTGYSLDGEGGPAAGVAVELRQNHAVEVDTLLEGLGDSDGLLTGHRVEDEQHHAASRPCDGGQLLQRAARRSAGGRRSPR